MRRHRAETAPLSPEGEGKETTKPAGLPLPWVWLSICTALLAAAGSMAGLLFPTAIYGGETSTLFDASIAQDFVNLFLVAPLVVLCSVLAGRGSLPEWLCVPGLLVLTAYNYASYAIPIRFGPKAIHRGGQSWSRWGSSPRRWLRPVAVASPALNSSADRP